MDLHSRKKMPLLHVLAMQPSGRTAKGVLDTIPNDERTGAMHTIQDLRTQTPRDLRTRTPPTFARPTTALSPTGIELRRVDRTSIPPRVAIKTIVGDIGNHEAGSRRSFVAQEGAIAIAPSKEVLAHNYRLADLARKHVRSMLTQGSNAAGDVKLGEQEALARIDEFRSRVYGRLQAQFEAKKIPGYIEQTPDRRLELFLRRTDVALACSDMLRWFGYGHCEEQSAAAYCFLLQQGLHPSSVEMCQVSSGDHAMVVIGRRPDSDPEDMRTWGANAVVCDPWANKVYPLSAFKEMQRPENDVRNVLAPHPPHYLAGTLRIRSEMTSLPILRTGTRMEPRWMHSSL